VKLNLYLVKSNTALLDSLFICMTYIVCSGCVGAISIEIYDLRKDSWSQVANMNGRRLQFGIGVIDGLLFVVGGRDGLKTLNTVECFDPKKKQWTMMTSMGTHRHGLGESLTFYIGTVDLFTEQQQQ